jgi:hypothetical protein
MPLTRFVLLLCNLSACGGGGAQAEGCSTTIAGGDTTTLFI